MTVPELVTASDIATYVYCPRKLWLIREGNHPRHENLVRGEVSHAVVDASSKSVTVTDFSSGVTGVCDVIDGKDIIEYKSSRPGKIPVIRDHHLAQLAAYRHCARAEGREVGDVFVWFTDQRRKVLVSSDDLDRFDIPDLSRRVRDVLKGTQSPPVLEDDPRCRKCSLVEVCQPSEEAVTNHAIAVPLPDGRLLFVDSSMTHVKLKSEQIYADLVDGTVRKFPIDKVSGMVVLNDRAVITTPLIVALLDKGKSITYTKFGSIPVGFSAPSSWRNGISRQRVATLPDDVRVLLAAEMIRAKINNQAARCGTSPKSRKISKQIRALRESLIDSELLSTDIERAIDRIFGAEGAAARLYFEVYFSELPEWVTSCGSIKRIGRGAYDPVNILLNYGYAMLHGAVTRAVLANGLDPAMGVLHSPFRNKPALILDIGEQFRVPLVDTTVRTLMNTKVISQKSFVEARGRWGMTKEARRSLISTFSDKLSASHTYLPEAHEMSWERSIEYQVRAFIRYIDGSADTWKGIYVR